MNQTSDVKQVQFCQNQKFPELKVHEPCGHPWPVPLQLPGFPYDSQRLRPETDRNATD